MSTPTPTATPTPLYTDKYVDVAMDGITLHNYYFPIATKKKLSITAIAAYFTMEKAMIHEKTWGMALPYCSYWIWWPLRAFREFEKEHTSFVFVLKDNSKVRDLSKAVREKRFFN